MNKCVKSRSHFLGRTYFFRMFVIFLGGRTYFFHIFVIFFGGREGIFSAYLCFFLKGERIFSTYLRYFGGENVFFPHICDIFFLRGENVFFPLIFDIFSRFNLEQDFLWESSDETERKRVMYRFQVLLCGTGRKPFLAKLFLEFVTTTRVSIIICQHHDGA